MIKTCLVIPCYNEEGRLKLEEFKKYLPEVDMLFVNDGSRDGTKALLEDFSQNEGASFLNCVNNAGKAEAVRQGVLKAIEMGYDFIGYLDADLATPLNQVSRLQNAFKENTDLVMGSRVLRLGGNIERKWYRHILGRVFATVASKLLDIPVYDTQCGAKIFRKEIAEQIFKEKFISYWIFDVELLFRMKKIRGPELISRVVEYPLEKWRDEKGSKLSAFDFLKAPLEMFKIYRRYR